MSSVQQNVIKHKVGLLNLAAELGNVSRACKVMGFSRDTFYRYQSALETGGVDALIDANRKKPNPQAIGSRKQQNRQLPPLLLSSLPLVKCGCPTNCASAASSFLPPAFARSGCAATWNRSRSACLPWSAMLPKPATS